MRIPRFQRLQRFHRFLGFQVPLLSAAGATCLAIAAVACSHESPVAPAPAAGCTYVVTPTTVQVTTQTHDIEVAVKTGAGCQWTISTSENWILLTGATSRQGPDVFVMHVLLSTTERRGTVTVSWAGGNQAITVTQSCSVTQTVNLSPESQSYLVDVPGCSFLSAPVSVDVPWISALTPLGEVLSLSLDVNNGPERSGFVTTALGVLTIVQRAGNCVTAIAPISQAFDESGGAGSISVTAVPGCAWDATSHNPGFPDEVAPLITHGIGSGVVPFTIAANKSLLTSAPFFIVGGSLKFQITQSACPLTVSPLSFHVPANAASYVVSVMVTGAVSCNWNAGSTDKSIIDFGPFSNLSRSGSGDAQFSVTQNTTGKTRSATAGVAGYTVVVTQDP